MALSPPYVSFENDTLDLSTLETSTLISHESVPTNDSQIFNSKDDLPLQTPHPSTTTTTTTFTVDELIELSILRDEEIDNIIQAGLLPASSRFDTTLHNQLIFHHPELTLTIYTGPHYPAANLPSYTIENISLPRLIVDGIRIALRRVIAAIDEGADARLRRWLTRTENVNTYGAFESEMAALQLAKAAHELLVTHRASVPAPTRPLPPQSTAVPIDSASRARILESQLGVDTSSYSTPAAVESLLGKPIADICALLPREYRVLHVENVIKPSLYADFHATQQRIRTRLLSLTTQQLLQCVPAEHHPSSSSSSSSAAANDERTRESLAAFLVRPHCTFHGTQRHAVANIVRTGFLRPGDTYSLDRSAKSTATLEVRCGSTYGRGIYTSPSPRFSLLYSGYEATATPTTHFTGLKLIVCATIMGRPARLSRTDNWRDQSTPYPGADSHVANNDLEYVVFQPRQCIPVLVVHLDWGKEHYEEFANAPSANTLLWVAEMRRARKEKRAIQGERGELFPGEVVARKQALQAKARKWFPYGYGPATGTAFVVEAVADDSDDEEEYGEYQTDKVEETDNKKGGYFWDTPALDGEHPFLDEFCIERRAKPHVVKQTNFKEDAI
ncbi:hypothetical protein DRE_06088 [Drechslerella stenobrocha 248]|uniref:PARP catalytic domain-containing protein n=1 Tax=Drechslerella stenobrocha 248 TaxID=1043628 RepID=W7I869_9PEZI|nr:hypothetical protein DRE_06088 [Drechslerella stenobrocha 248]